MPSDPSSDSSGAWGPIRTGMSASSTSATASAGRPAAISRGDPLLADHPEEVPPGVHDREPGPAVAQEELLLGVQQRRLGGDRHRLAIHDVAHRDVLDPLGELALDDRLGGRLVEEERQQQRQQRRGPVPCEQADHAQQAEQQREGLARAAGDQRGPVAVAGAPPDQRPRDPAAVEGEGGDDVEHAAGLR